MCLQVGKELGGGHQGAVYELLDGKGTDSGQVLKVSCNCQDSFNCLPQPRQLSATLHADSTGLLQQLC